MVEDGGTGRVVGVDVARFCALVGMMATHIFPGVRPDGTVHPALLIAAGRAAALFAVLAGVSLALAHGRRRPPAGRALWAARAGVLARALFLIALGLPLARVPSPPIVILAYYGLLFVAVSPFLGLRARHLALLAVVSAIGTPLVSQALRDRTDLGDGVDVSGVHLLVELTVTGTYPVLTWLTYAFAGMAVGRSDLRSRATAVRLLVGGLAVAVVAKLVAAGLLASVGGVDTLSGEPDPSTALQHGLLGTTPAGDWHWLLIAAPHSGTTLDLAHTTGTAMAVLGACLLVVPRLPRPVVVPLAAAGSMTLTLYTAHVLALADDSPLWIDDPLRLWLAHMVVAVLVALSWRTFLGRGPLERVAGALDRGGTALIENRDRPRPARGRDDQGLDRGRARYGAGVIRVGLTGGIGSGKSEVARLLLAHGAVVVDADALAREAVAPGTPGLQAVVAEFGPEVLAPDGSLDRARLAQLVFADTARRRALEAIVHPYVGRRSAELMAAAPPDAVVVYDVPLLVENDLWDGYDVVVVVDASDETRLHRLVDLREMGEEDARARMSAQVSRAERLAVADHVVENNGDLVDLGREVDQLWHALTRGRVSAPLHGTSLGNVHLEHPDP